MNNNFINLFTAGKVREAITRLGEATRPGAFWFYCPRCKKPHIFHKETNKNCLKAINKILLSFVNQLPDEK